MKNLAFVFPLLLLFAGCTTVTYKPASSASPAKPAGYPIPIYTEDMKVPRPCEIIGSLSINAGSLTMFGGSSEKELKELIQTAHEKGADAVRLVSMEKPGFKNPNYRLTADLLRYADVWETVSISRREFQAYLDANRRNLDPIEGLWFSDGLNPHSIGIMKNNSKPGRSFVGFILDSNSPAWRTGAKKMDVRRGLESGSYVLNYYLDDFERAEIPVILGQKRTFALAFQKAEENPSVITYVKN